MKNWKESTKWIISILIAILCIGLIILGAFFKIILVLDFIFLSTLLKRDYLIKSPQTVIGGILLLILSILSLFLLK